MRLKGVFMVDWLSISNGLSNIVQLLVGGGVGLVLTMIPIIKILKGQEQELLDWADDVLEEGELL